MTTITNKILSKEQNPKNVFEKYFKKIVNKTKTLIRKFQLHRRLTKLYFKILYFFNFRILNVIKITNF